MTTEKKDPTIFGRFITPMLAIMMLVAGVTLATLLLCPKPPSNQAIILIAAVLALGVGCLTVLHHRVFGRYRCPQCGAHLPRYQKEPERQAEYRYFCQRCDVIWNTGIRKGNGEA